MILARLSVLADRPLRPHQAKARELLATRHPWTGSELALLRALVVTENGPSRQDADLLVTLEHKHGRAE
jgi:hypothetical protein